MSEEYHYVRTLGDDGGVEVCEGPAIGLDLESILKDGLPPWNIALEIVAGLCEILDIADEDGEVHGDLGPKDVFVDDTGAISVEGFHVERARSRAPEGSPRGSATDLYGLGYIAFRLFCSASLPELPNDDPDGHDDAIIDAILLVDLDGVPEEMQGDIQWFLAKLMSFDREDRPSAVEAWRTFIAFADGTDGPDFVSWCTEAIEGGGERRQEHAGPKEPPAAAPPADDEDLGGPVMRSGPLAKGAISFDAGGAPKGQATAFWSKDAMKAALEKAEAEDEDHSFRPAAGGGSATAFWSKEQLDAMREGKTGAPRPKRSSKRSQTMMMAAPKKGGESAPPPAPPPAAPVAPPPPQPIAQQQQPVRPSPPPPQPVIQGPVPQPPPPVAAEGGSKTGLVVGGVVVLVLVLILGCVGLGGVGGVAVLLSGGSGEAIADAEPTPQPEPEPVPKEEEDTDPPEKAAGTADGDPKPAPKPRPKPAPKSSPAPAPTSAPKPAPKPTPKPKPAPAPAPTTGGPAKVTFVSSGRGTVSCAGTNKDFDGPTSLVLDEYLLPATCLVTIEGKRGVFQVYATGNVTCNLAGGAVECDKMVVQ